MQGKKKYLALILFLLIGLMVFTFANPASTDEKDKGSKKGADKEVVKKEETKKDDDSKQTFNPLPNGNNLAFQNTNEEVEQVINEDNESNKVDDSYEKALAAVEKAEETLTIEDLNNAQELVNNLLDGTNKDELNERLDVVLDLINAIELVEKLEQMVNEAENIEDMTDARNYNYTNKINEVVNSLSNESLKEELLNRLEKLAGLLDDINSPVVNGLNDGDFTNSVKGITINDENEYTVTLNGNPYVIGTELEEDGEYVLVIVDAAFNETVINFTFDKTVPVLTVKNSSVGTDGVYSKIDFSLHDNIGLAKVVVNEKEYPRNGIWNDLNFQNVNNYVEGENTVTLFDLAGNSVTFNFVLDKTAPVYSTLRIIGGTRNASDNTYYAKETDKIYVYVTFNEMLGKNPVVKIGGKEYECSSVKELSDGSYLYYSNSIVAKALEEGLVMFEVYGYQDKAGNEGAKLTNDNITLASQSKVIVDKTMPVLTVKNSSVGTDGVYSKIDFSLHDNIGLAKVVVNEKEYPRNGIWNDLNFQNVNNYVEGENTVTLFDLAGNSVTFNFVLDKTAPVYSTLRIIGGTRNASDNTYYAKETDKIYVYVTFNEMLGKNPIVKIGDKEYECSSVKELSDGSYLYYSNSIVAKALEEGLVMFEVYGYQDKAGNEGTKLTNDNITLASQSKVIVDKTVPVLTVKNSFVGTDGLYSKIDFSLHDNIGLAKVVVNEKEYPRNGIWNDLNFQNVNNYVEGENTVTLFDLAGNSVTFNFVIDRILPTATITLSNNGQLTSESVTVTLVASEPIIQPEGWTKVNDVTFTKVYEQNAENETVTIADFAFNKTTLQYDVTGIQKENYDDLDFVFDGSSNVIETDRISEDNPILVNDLLNEAFEGKNLTSQKINQLDVTYVYTSKTGSVQSMDCILEINGKTYTKTVTFDKKNSGEVTVSFKGLELEPNDNFIIRCDDSKITNGNISITGNSVTVFFE